MYTENREETLPDHQRVEHTSPTATMTEYIDEGSGAPATPRNKKVQQTLDRHGTDDTDEYGATPTHASTSNVTMVGTEKGSVLNLDPREEMVTPDEDAQDGSSEPTPEDMVVFVDELKKRAQATRMTDDSERYEKQKLPISQLLIYVESLESPKTPRTGSSS